MSDSSLRSLLTAPEPVVPPSRPIGPLVKRATGIAGLDEITGGGVPIGRLVAITGGPGCGKTVLALQMLVDRMIRHGERGLFVTLEETEASVRQNIAGFDWGPGGLGATGLTLLEGVVGREVRFDATRLLAMVGEVQSRTGAQNVVLDGLDVLLHGFSGEGVERHEMSRISDWIAQRNVCCLVTLKAQGTGARELMRDDSLHYASDCVITLNSSLQGTVVSRTLRVIKYRGSGFAADAFPMVISRSGVEVVATGTERATPAVPHERVSTGVAQLDRLLEGGYLRGTSVLVSGAPGTAKSSFAAAFAEAACARGEPALMVSFEEHSERMVADMRSIGLELETHLAEGRLRMLSLRPGTRSPEEQFLAIRRLIEEHRPKALVIDPVSALESLHYPFAATIIEALIEHARSLAVTTLCTSLVQRAAGSEAEMPAGEVATLADTWIHLSYRSRGGERNRALTIVKSRGTAHSNQVHEVTLSASGIEIVPVHASDGEVLMGRARSQREAASRQRQLAHELEMERQAFESKRAVALLEAQLELVTRELDWKRREGEIDAALTRSRQSDRPRSARQRALPAQDSNAPPDEGRR